ncbi:hypothetical protein WKK05_34270 [Nostoc sp. UHCC 0302]|uniref:hypothetical protein n=1 Tax=Nostoc sp. UHCC 0302 TaxID=3134896 RepID=UPI00311C9D0E
MTVCLLDIERSLQTENSAELIVETFGLLGEFPKVMFNKLMLPGRNKLVIPLKRLGENERRPEIEVKIS